MIGNRFVHLARWGRAAPGGTDPFCSLDAANLVTLPESWLLREGWTRAGPIAEGSFSPTGALTTPPPRPLRARATSHGV